ncbi:MAG: NAD(P)/FAD-dependent oxidoreductase [Burkholderiales bacterium]|nr:NAD(P)/FAD-dependent oxidoreductase [Burkholderiales bacterium]
MKHVIIGNGPAGVVAAEALRRADPAAEIVLVGDENEPPYSRMAIPYLLTGNIGEAGTYLRKDAGHYEHLGIRLVRARAEKVDSKARSVTLSNKEKLPYDRLLIATGSHPLQPRIPGIDLPNVHPCWTLADAREIAAKAKKGARVVQLGAGFIGSIILQALAERGVKLCVVEMGDRMVPRMMTEKAGNLIRLWVEEKGVAVHVNARAEAITSVKGGAMQVKLSNGQSIECDLLISAAGVRPNIAFLEGSGVKVGDGILVNERMQTSVPEIYAAGDVTEATGFHSGKPELNAIQPNAADQARVAAANMSGAQTAMQGSLAINVLDTLGLVSTSFGQWEGAKGGEGVELVDEANFRYLSLQFKDDVLVGATSIGWTNHVGALRGLIQGRVHLGDWKARLLADPTQFMTAYLGAAQKAA